MRIEQFEIFSEITQMKSFTTAAQNLHITQSALSKAIKVLEDEINLSLFNRSNHIIELTPEGQMLLPYVNAILESIQAFSDYANYISQKSSKKTSEILSGSLTIYTIAPITQTFLLKGISEFTNHFPEVYLNILEQIPNNVYQLIEEGNLDIAFFSAQDQYVEHVCAEKGYVDLIFQPLYYTSSSVIVNTKCSLAQKKSVTQKDLLPYDLVYTAGDSIYEDYNGALPMPKGCRLHLKYHTNNWNVMKELILNNSAICCVMTAIIDKLDIKNDDRFTVIPLHDNIKRLFGCMYRKNSNNINLIEAFLTEQMHAIERLI